MAKEIAKTMNPFILTPARKNDFINRKEIINNILDTIIGRGLGDVWIEGERQVGKTSLLQYLEFKGDEFVPKFVHYHTETEMIPVFLYVNVQAIDSPKEFFKELSYTIKSRFDIKNSKNKKTEYEEFIALVSQFFKQGYYIIFLIDEFDSMLENFENRELLLFIKKFNSTLESFSTLTNKPKAFSCIFAANSSFSEVLYNKNIELRSQSGLKFEAFELDWFTFEHVKELAEKYLAKNKLKFTQKEIELCYKYTRGYPYFTQKMFRIMYQAKLNIKDEKEFEKYVKKELGKEIVRTIEAWGSEKMPKRTIVKLQELFNSSLKDKFFDIISKTIDTYIKTQLFR